MNIRHTSKSAASLTAGLLALCSHASAQTSPADTAPAPATKPASLQEALLQGKPALNARLRYESVDQDGFTDADALTLRIRAGYTTGVYRGFQAMIEGEANVPLVKDYFDATGTNTSNHAVVADPEVYELNQAWLSYTYEKTRLAVGRQRVVLDNGRFVGDVAWRQNQQTFDGVVLTDKTVDDLSLTYGYLARVNRVFDDRAPQYDWVSDSHVVHASYSGLHCGTLSAYAYLLDFTETQDGAMANSTQTYGLSFAGSAKLTDDVDALYRFEYATQRDYASSPLDYQADYYLAELGAKFLKNYGISIGYEVLGSDNGVAAFRTPLATLHAFNGWADRFLVTPADGLEDTYIKATAALPANLTFTGFYHWFRTNDTDREIGTELDLQLAYKFNKQLSFLAKAALYDGESGSPAPGKTNKYWLQADYAF
jgi:hypothetical protein